MLYSNFSPAITLEKGVQLLGCVWPHADERNVACWTVLFVIPVSVTQTWKKVVNKRWDNGPRDFHEASCDHRRQSNEEKDA